jgi:hypothetical protein
LINSKDIQMTNESRMYSNPTQRYWVCFNLISGRVLSTQDEISEAKGWRLAAVIHALAHEFGWPICSEYRGKDNIKHYWLAPGTDPASLRYPRSAQALAQEGGAL